MTSPVSSTNIAQQCKWRRIALALAAGRKMTKFDAMQLHDFSMSATVARLKSYGIPVVSRLVERPGYAGSPAWVAEYSIPDEADRAFARRLALGTRKR